MRTSELCNTWKKAATRWPSIWERAGDILFSKSSRPRKTQLADRFDESSDHGGRAILRFWWPIRRKLEECWDGPPNAISPTSCRVRGLGCRKNRAALEQESLSTAGSLKTRGLEVPFGLLMALAKTGSLLAGKSSVAAQKVFDGAPSVGFQ